MKTLSYFSCFAITLLLMAHFSPLAAQYNPPPPPDQANTGESFQQGQVPPPDQGAPGPSDDSVPPPDASQQGDPDQGPPDQGDANFQTFYDNLSSQGNWVQTDNYGYVFQPNEDDPDWAPYTDGHWVYTDEGWTWLADESEPWGWATYHYGRWANLDGYGWVWVPGYTWAPAWVSWRYGDGYCGWAPLPPETFIGVDVGGVGSGFVFHIGGDCDTAFDIGPRYYNFIPVGYLGARNYRHHFADRNNNFVIINNTRNVTNIVVNNHRGSGRFGRVSTGGPDIATIDAQSTNRIQRVQLARSNRVGDASLNGNRLAVYAPHVNATNAGTFRPARVSEHVANVRVNNGARIDQPLQVNSRVRQRAADPAQITAAQSVHFSEGSHVATPNAHPTHTFNRPLTSFAPRQNANANAAANATVQSNRGVNASANATRPEGAFTGQNGNEVHGNNHHDHVNAQVQQNAVTPPVQAQAQVQHHDFNTQQEDRQQRVQQEPVQQQQAQHQEVQHQDFHPQGQGQQGQGQQGQHHEEHQESHTQTEQHREVAAPAQHNAAGGNGGNHPSNGGNNGKDKKNQ